MNLTLLQAIILFLMGWRRKEKEMVAYTLYPKRWMTINELVDQGFSIRDLKQWVHIKGFPAMKGKAKNSPWKIDTIRLEPWLIKNGHGFIPCPFYN